MNKTKDISLETWYGCWC